MENKFREIFRGLERNFGKCDLSNAKVNPDTGKLVIPVNDYGWSGRPVTDEDYQKHLDGEISIGIQPCTEEGKVIFAAIDVDQYKDFNKEQFFKRLHENEIPLIPVKSKSGGFHLYLHLKEPTSAVMVKKFLKGLLYTLKLPTKTEIFPKQTDTSSSVGNFINLPYFGKTERVAIDPRDGSEFTFEKYLQVVEVNKQSKKDLDEFMNELTSKELSGGSEEFKSGPPCLQQLSKKTLTDFRDRFMYQYMVFAKKKYGDQWDKKVLEAARQYIQYDNIWGDEKIKKKIRSWTDKETGYKCEEVKAEGYCMEELCYKREFGKKTDKIIQWPELSSLTKIEYEEPEYRVTVTIRDQNGDEKSVQIKLKSIDDLYEMRLLRKQIGKQANTFLPKLKDKDFDPIVADLLKPGAVEIQTPPEGTSNKAKMFKYIKEFVKSPAETLVAFESGRAFVKDKEDKLYFIFDKFYDALKRKEWKVGEQKTAQWMKEWFDAKFDTRPRIPKKGVDPKDYPQVSGCVQLRATMFKSETRETEIVEMKDREDIL